MDIWLWSNPRLSKRRESTKSVLYTFNPGVTMLIGPNGSGKTTALSQIRSLFSTQDDLIKKWDQIDKNDNIRNLYSSYLYDNVYEEKFAKESLRLVKERLKNQKRVYGDVNLIIEQLLIPAAQVKDIAFQLKGEMEKVIFIAGGVMEGKPHLTIMVSNNLVDEFGIHAGQIIREAAREIKGGGGGQPFFATAGGSNPDGIEKALETAEKMIMHKIQVD